MNLLLSDHFWGQNAANMYEISRKTCRDVKKKKYSKVNLNAICVDQKEDRLKIDFWRRLVAVWVTAKPPNAKFILVLKILQY